MTETRPRRATIVKAPAEGLSSYGIVRWAGREITGYADVADGATPADRVYSHLWDAAADLDTIDGQLATAAERMRRFADELDVQIADGLHMSDRAPQLDLDRLLAIRQIRVDRVAELVGLFDSVVDDEITR